MNQDAMRQHGKSFHWAAHFLTPTARQDSQLLYAFARHADDLADEPTLGSLTERLAVLTQWRVALQSQQDHAMIPYLQALRDLQKRHAWPPGVLDHFLNSLIEDAGARQLQTEAQLLAYAYGVAGTVGLMMRPLLGAAPQAQAYAVALGVAMQLTNIARDVVEDALRGRSYIPLDSGADPLATLQRPSDAAARERSFDAITRVLQLAEEFYDFANSGLHFIPKPNQRAIRIALALYRGIGRKILRRGAARYWQGRVHLGRIEKIALTLSSLRTSPAAPTAQSTPPQAWHTLQTLPGLAGP
jgi:15-cis-phytoene synthase